MRNVIEPILLADGVVVDSTHPFTSTKLDVLASPYSSFFYKVVKNSSINITLTLEESQDGVNWVPSAITVNKTDNASGFLNLFVYANFVRIVATAASGECALTIIASAKANG